MKRYDNQKEMKYNNEQSKQKIPELINAPCDAPKVGRQRRTALHHQQTHQS